MLRSKSHSEPHLVQQKACTRVHSFCKVPLNMDYVCPSICQHILDRRGRGCGLYIPQKNSLISIGFDTYLQETWRWHLWTGSFSLLNFTYLSVFELQWELLTWKVNWSCAVLLVLYVHIYFHIHKLCQICVFGSNLFTLEEQYPLSCTLKSKEHCKVQLIETCLCFKSSLKY